MQEVLPGVVPHESYLVRAGFDGTGVPGMGRNCTTARGGSRIKDSATSLPPDRKGPSM